MIIKILTALLIHAALPQDSLPALHNLPDDSIATIDASFQTDTLKVTMKNGVVYAYAHADWDAEDYFATTSPRVREAIRSIQRTFTRTEAAPEYPGGDEAWANYLSEFCSQHAKEIKKKPTDIMVQFIVHLKGQITNLELMAGEPHNKQAELALQAVRESGPWKPAIQNGHKVICYKKVLVKLSR